MAQFIVQKLEENVRKTAYVVCVGVGGGLKFLFSVFYTTLYIVYVVFQDDAMP